MHDFQVGDEVEYLPHECHAQNRSPTTGDYPWVMGLKRVRVDDTTTPPTQIPFVETLSDGRLASYLDWLRRLHPESAEREKANLVFLRPKAPWKAKVVQVNEDGTLDLAIESNQGGVTLNYTSIPVDEVAATPHTCRKRSTK